LIKVMLADDEDLVRSGLRMILSSAGDIEVVAECDDGLLVADLARQHRPHVVLLDVRMRSADGLVALRRLRTLPEPPRVAMLTTFDVDEYVSEALRLGASGFLLKDTEPDDLVDAIRRVAAGQGLVDQSVTRRVIREFARRRPAAASAPRPAAGTADALTAREAEIVKLLAQGMSNAEIAAALVVEVSTVKSHLSRAMSKIGARDRVQTVIWAYRNGLMPADPD